MTMVHSWRQLANVFAGLAIMAPAIAAAQATITGTVRSTQGQALQAANVRIANLNISIGTGVDGSYRITLPADRVRGQLIALSARAIGHRPQNKEFTLTAGQHTVDFALEYDANRSSEVVVTEARADTARSKAEKVLAFTVDRSGAVTYPSGDFSQHLFPPELIMQHQARLKITEAQRNTIVAEITKLQATAVQVQWRVGDESEKLSQLLQRESIDEAEALAQVDKVINNETAVKRAQLAMLIRIRNVLTAEQKALLRELRRRD